LLTVVSLLEWW